MTGCCHQSILTVADFAREKITGAEKLYGVNGGLHIVPFGPMDPQREHIVKGMGKYNFQKIACNHCTGLAAVEKMIELWGIRLCGERAAMDPRVIFTSAMAMKWFLLKRFSNFTNRYGVISKAG